MVQTLKKNTVKKLSKFQQNEIRLCADPINGPIHFLNNYVQVKCAGFVQFKARDYQQLAVYHFNSFQKNLLLWSRQSGKCVDAGTKIVLKYIPTDQVIQTTMGEFYKANNKKEHLQTTYDKKFIESYYVDNWLVHTDTGWSKIRYLHKTVKYQIHTITTQTGMKLRCADLHKMFDKNMNEVYAKDCRDGKTVVQTTNGPEKVIRMRKEREKVHMFDLELDDENHRYYTDGILSHNTTVVSMYLLWDAMFRQGHDILVTANKMDQATGEILDRINDAYEFVPEWLRAGMLYNAVEKKVYDTKSRIICRATSPGSARGTSPAILYCDEFAIIPSLQVQEEFFSSMLPAISRTKGKFIMSTTPLTDYDTFAKLWRGSQRMVDDEGMNIQKKHWIIMDSEGYVKGKYYDEMLASDAYDAIDERNDKRIVEIEEPGFNDFKGHKVTCRELPDWSEEWEKTERATTGDDVKFDREYYLVFTGESEGLIESTAMRKIQRHCEKTKPLFINNKVRFYKEIDPFCTYMVSLDPSMGVGKDYACMQIFELPGMVQVGEWMRNDVNSNGQIKVLREILDFIHGEMVANGDRSPELFWSFENNTLGEAIVALIEELGEENFKGTCISDIKKHSRPNMRQGFWVDGKRKIYGCNKLKTLAERGKIQFNSIELARQLSFFVQKGNSFAAKSGVHDDAVMAVICNLLMLEKVAMWDESISSEMKDQFDEVEPMPVMFEINN